MLEFREDDLLQIVGAGGCENASDIISVDTRDFILKVNGMPFRFHIHDDGIGIALINGVDAVINNVSGYPGIDLVYGGRHEHEN